MKSRVLFLLIAVLCASPAWGQVPRVRTSVNNTLVVSVRLVSGERLPGLARMELFRGDMPVEEAYSDSRGQHTFYGLAEGPYSVRISLPGFQSQLHDAQLGGDATRYLPAFLRPGDETEWKEDTSGLDPTISVRWLAAPKKARKEVSKARQLRSRQDYEGAVKRLRRALEIYPSFAIAHNELGQCYRQKEKLTEAQKSFEAAIQHDPEYLDPYLNLGELLSQKKEYDQAARVLLQASKARPNRGEPYYAMAKIQYDTGHLDRAEQACRLALERDTSKIPEVHILLANVYLRRGEKAKLAAELEAYLAKAPDGPYAETARATLEKIQHEQVQTLPVPPKP